MSLHICGIISIFIFYFKLLCCFISFWIHFELFSFIHIVLVLLNLLFRLYWRRAVGDQYQKCVWGVETLTLQFKQRLRLWVYKHRELQPWLRCGNCYDCFCARLPLDEKLFERDLQAALQLSKQSTEDEKDVKIGLMKNDIIIYSVVDYYYYFFYPR